ncbi:MAG TPA: heme lyase CcmF/NrfE family subunit [Acidobacteriota bacterium]|nr:heme lyase CcmF/NrfE family subunit [Acidobacteriota bacterium]
MANFGNFCILFALCLSLYTLIAALFGAAQRQHRIIKSAEHAVFATCVSITLAFLVMVYLLLTDDFATSHVANTSNSSLPFLYKFAAIWGGHDGSLLLWVLFAAVINVLVVHQNRFRNREMMPWVLAGLMFNIIFFLVLILFLANPFDQLVEVFPDGTLRQFIPADGRGMNPLLQYWAMLVHPPVLYVGFVGFVVPFAFAIAALITKQKGDAWIRTTRRWTLISWLFLGAGIILGGKWAYVVLGWGGYWAWDPVENASLMPWLLSTAFLHSVIVQERRGMLKTWNVLLIVFTYLLCIFGTFLTRSGIVTSIHAFAESNLGGGFIIYIAIVLVISLSVIWLRRPYLKSERRLDSMASRESAFLFNNLLFVAACFAVFWGTMFPVFSEWLQGTRISVGPVFFNKITIPIGLLLLLLTGLGPLFAWHKTSLESLKKAFLIPGAFAVATGIILLLSGMRNFAVLVCMILSAFVITTIIEEFYKGARTRMRGRKESFPAAVFNLTLKNNRRYGGYIVHFGVVLMFIGLAGNAFNRNTTAFLNPGESLSIGDYVVRLAAFEEGHAANYHYGRAVLEAYKNDRLLGTLRTEKRVFDEGHQPTTTVGLHSTLKEDLYLIFAGVTADSRYEIKAFVNPLVFWVWAGSGILVLGTLLTLVRTRQQAITPGASY